MHVKWKKLLKDLKETHSELYELERQRVQLNRDIQLRKNKLEALLNYLRTEGKNEEFTK